MKFLHQVTSVILLFVVSQNSSSSPRIEVSWGDTKEVVKSISFETENCDPSPIEQELISEINSNEGLIVSGRRTDSASASVDSKIGEIKVGREIENSYSSNFESSKIDTSKLSIEIPKWSAKQSVKFDIVEVWREGILTVKEERIFFNDKINNYKIEKLEGYRLGSIKKTQFKSCLNDKWEPINKSISLQNFKNIDGDCEMDTNNNDHVRFQLTSKIILQGDSVKLKALATAFEGKGSDYGDTVMHAEQTFLLKQKKGWKAVAVNLPIEYDSTRQIIYKGKMRGYKQMDKTIINNSPFKNVKLLLDTENDDDCRHAAVKLTVNFKAKWKETEANRL